MMDTTTEKQAEINLQDPMAVRQAGLDAQRSGEIRDYTAERHAGLDGISREALIAQARAMDALRRGEK
jgi:hypothetical protein